MYTTRTNLPITLTIALKRLNAFAIISLIVFELCGLVFPGAFLVDLVGNFLVQAIILAICGLVFFIVTREWTLFFASLLVLLCKGYLIFPYLNNAGVVDEANKHEYLRVMVSNVHGANTRYQDVIEGIMASAPQIVAFVEVNDEWSKQIEILSKDYSYSETFARPDNFGLAIYSKFPLNDVQFAPLGENQPPIVKASIAIAGEEILFFLIHTFPPKDEHSFALRNQELASISRVIKKEARKSILVGDFNATPWSKHFHDLLVTAGLVDPRRSFGLLPTWPQDFFPFFIPIDHLLTSPDIAIIGLNVHATPGSDHRALVADILLTNRISVFTSESRGEQYIADAPAVASNTYK